MVRWKELSDFLLYKYLDGNVKDAQGKVTHPGYPESWYQEVAAATGDRLQMRRMPAELALKEEEKAKAKEIADAVLTLLEGRGVVVDEETRAGIEAVEDPEDERDAGSGRNGHKRGGAAPETLNIHNEGT